MVYTELASRSLPKIVTIGVGGGGSNAVNHMSGSGMDGVHFIVANTDMQDLNSSAVETKIQLGNKRTAGLGAGARPEVGYEAAQESKGLIQESLGEPNLVFISAGMGGGTGTGAAPVIAEIAREMGALTVGVVTKPFAFEGKKRMASAEAGIEELRKHVHSLITIPNEQLIQQAPKNAKCLDMFKIADDVLYLAVKGIVELLTKPGRINLDFADLRTVMGGEAGGIAMMGTGVGVGETRARDAANQAIHSPFLEDVSIDGARGVLFNITANNDVGMREIEEAAGIIQAAAHPDADIIFGTVLHEDDNEEFRVTVVATGINNVSTRPARAASSAKISVFESEKHPHSNILSPIERMLKNNATAVSAEGSRAASGGFEAAPASARYAVAGQSEYSAKNEVFTFHRQEAEVPFFLQK
ncbi:MAG: cell division protein FtsZ [Deltaproteobacteria bacterium]|jgi:cell division protein FtsZ|nr:cell division protein FtsZ [Deltaproteobacteria bacterium]